MMNRPALVKLTNGLKRTAPNRILLLKKNTLVHHDGETPDENLKRSGISYHERIVLGYSSQQLCDIVADVGKYKEFVPFCTNSEILDDANLSSYTNIPTSTGNRFNLKAISRTDDLSNRRLGRYLNMTANKNQLRAPSTFSARLEIGYPPIIESYISNVTTLSPKYVRAVSHDTQMFQYLLNEWKFQPYILDEKSNKENEACLVDFYVSFKFHSVLYSTLSQMFMEKVFYKMVGAFTERAYKLHGKPSIKPIKLNT